MQGDGSFFSKYKKGSEPERGKPPAANQARPPAPAGQDAARLAGLETAVAALRKELAEMRSASGVAAPVVRLALPPELAERLAKSEAAVTDLKRELASQKEQLREYAEGAVSRDSVKAGEARLERLEVDVAGFSRAVQADRDLAARLERSEVSMTELRRELAAQRDALRDYQERSVSKDLLRAFETRLSGFEAGLSGLSAAAASETALALRLEKAEAELAGLRHASEAATAALERRLTAMPDNNRLEGLRGEFSEVINAFETMKKSFSAYADNFSGIERECRKALGDVQGYARGAARQTFEEGWGEHLKNSVGILSTKLADVETGLRAALADISGRVAAGEALHNKITASVEERLRKAIEPETKALQAGLLELRSKVTWLTDEYQVVMERKIRALEGQKGAFEAIVKRMDSLSEDIKRSNCG